MSVTRCPSTPRLHSHRALLWRLVGLVLAAGLAGGLPAVSAAADDNPGGPVILRQPGDAQGDAYRSGSTSGSERRHRDARFDDADRTDDGSDRARAPAAPRVPYVPSEFELFVDQLAAPAKVQRLGSNLVTRTDDRPSVDYSPLAPQDYVVKPGDEVLLTLWGSVVGDLRLIVDRSGRISVPRVGTVQVGGLRYAELAPAIERRVGQVFRNFELSASLGRLRGIRVYVTGYVKQPGAYTVSSLSTITQALIAADGPSGAGSFRNVELRRGSAVEARFDFYDFLLKGDRSGDRVVQPDDVIYVGPVGPQVALIGSVNQPAILEMKSGETIADVLRMAGDFNSVADRTRLAVERLDDRNDKRVKLLSLPTDAGLPVHGGDVLRAFSAIDVTTSIVGQNKRVRVEGEVAKPGDYVLPPGSTTADAIAAAGGLTSRAYVFGTEFSRQSVRQMQQANYDRALRDLEVSLTRSASSQRIASADEAAAQAARSTATKQLIERLKELKPSGRIVLQVTPDSREVPNLALEEGDRLYVPPLPTTVGVFGSVYNAGSFIWDSGRPAGSYLKLAGGPTRSADSGSIFMIRANGSVVSNPRGGFFSYGRGVDDVKAEAGDTIFVPDEIDRTTWVQDLKDWTQIVYQLGLGAAAIVAIRR